MAYRAVFNRPFPSTLVPLFQNESKCETFHMKMNSACSFIFIRMTRFETEAQGNFGNGLLIQNTAFYAPIVFEEFVIFI